MALLQLPTPGTWAEITGLVDATSYVLQNIGSQKIEIRETTTGDAKGYVVGTKEFFQIDYATGETWQARVNAKTGELKYQVGSIT